MARVTPIHRDREPSAPISTAAVDRAMGDLRRGRRLVIRDAHGGAAIVQAAENVSAESMQAINGDCIGAPVLVIAGPRAAALGIVVDAAGAVALSIPGGVPAEVIRDFADPLADRQATVRAIGRPVEVAAQDCADAAVELAKLAGLLPAALYGRLQPDRSGDLLGWARARDMLLVETGDIFEYREAAVRSLKRVAEARVPLADAESTRLIAFQPSDGGEEHLALVIGDPQPGDDVLVRLHSECFTGDLLGSLRCDCGEQLKGAIRSIDEFGKGMVLYLAQEGRGIGLVNKLRAYELQDGGFNTYEANHQLGFDADERFYKPAAEILRQLGHTRVRLLTNNPEKVAGLERCDIAVTERVPHRFSANTHNEKYLAAKAEHQGWDE